MMMLLRLLLAAAAAQAVAPPPAAAATAAVPFFGAAGHFSYQVPYGRDQPQWPAWPINTTEQLRVLREACGGPTPARRCVYKTDFPCGPQTFNITSNSSELHLSFMVDLVDAAAEQGIEVMGAVGVGSAWGVTSGGVSAEEFGRRMATTLRGHGPTGAARHWQLSDEWAVDHCMLPRVDYKHHWGMDKADFNASCMTSWAATMTQVMDGIHSVTPHAVCMPVSMGWTRLGVWQWLSDERVPLDAIGLDWYSDGGDINCTCTEYPPVHCGQPGHKPCINFLDRLEALFPAKPVFITEMNRKLGSCALPPVVAPPGSSCGNCSQADGCTQALADQASYVATALAKYEELAQAGYRIGGVIYYELLDQPRLWPSSEALYGLVRVVRDNSTGALSLGAQKPVMAAVRAWNMLKTDELLPTHVTPPHLESTGAQGQCLQFDAPTVVDVSASRELIANSFATQFATIGSAIHGAHGHGSDGTSGDMTLFATAFTAIPNGNTPSTIHVRANMRSRIYRSTDIGESWQTMGEASPNCAVGSERCNEVNVTWDGPLISCQGTAACGDVADAANKAFDLGRLAWSSRTTGLGPTISSNYIGVHSFSTNGAQIATIVNRTIHITGLPPLTTAGCPRGVDGAPLRISACNAIKLGSRIFLPVVVFLNSTIRGNSTPPLIKDSTLPLDARQTSKSKAVCYGHYSSIVLISTAATDGLTWKYEGVVAATNITKAKTDSSYEGPNECTIVELPATRGCAHCTPHLAVIFRDSEMRAGAPKLEHMQRGAYQVTMAPINLTGSPDQSGEDRWSVPTGISLSGGLPIGAVQPDSLWVSSLPHNGDSFKVLAMKTSRPGLHIYTGFDAHTREWAQDINIAAIHNKLVADQSLQFSAAFVESTIGTLENHGATIAKIDAHSFGIFYDRGVWSRPPVASRGEKDACMFMRARAVWCHNMSDAGATKTDDDESSHGSGGEWASGGEASCVVYVVTGAGTVEVNGCYQPPDSASSNVSFVNRANGIVLSRNPRHRGAWQFLNQISSKAFYVQFTSPTVPSTALPPVSSVPVTVCSSWMWPLGWTCSGKGRPPQPAVTRRGLPPVPPPPLDPPSPPALPPPPPPAMELVMAEDFSGSTLNRSRWQVYTGVHRGGIYELGNVVLWNGSLVLRTVAKNQSVGGTDFYVSSGAVNQSRLLEQRHGRWSARVKLPDVNLSPGWVLHSSVWLVNNFYDAERPNNGSSSGYSGCHQEIDIVEQYAAGLAPSTDSTAAGAIHASTGTAAAGTCNPSAVVRYTDSAVLASFTDQQSSRSRAAS